MRYQLVRILNSSVFMEESLEKLLEELNDGWEIKNIHNLITGDITIYLLEK